MADDLIREVNEALQQDRLHQLWKRYGGRILYGCAAIVVFSGGMIAWQQRETYMHQENTAALMEAREVFMGGDYDKAKTQFSELADKASGKQAVLANMWLAKTELALENQIGALDALAKVAASNKSADDAFVAMACLQGAMLAPDDKRFAGCLPTSADQPLHAMAKEHLAVQATAKHEFDKADITIEGAMPMTQQRRLEDVKAYLDSAKSAQKDAK